MMVHVQREELDESWCSESYKVISLYATHT